MKDFKELRVWQRAHQITLEIYAATRQFPPDERFGLTSQLRRSAASIGANVAEGCGAGRMANSRASYRLPEDQLVSWNTI